MAGKTNDAFLRDHSARQDLRMDDYARLPGYVSLHVAALLLLTGCGGGDGTSAPTGPDPLDAVATVSVSPTSFTINIGETLQLTATVRNGRGETVSASVSWSTSGPSVATVSSSGLVTGTGEGSAIITATASGRSGTSAATGIDPFPPDQPSDLQVAVVSNTEIDISWTDGSTNEDEFVIEREAVAAAPVSGASMTFEVVGRVGENVTSFRDSSLGPGASYRYKVTACNENGCSDEAPPVPGEDNEAQTYETLTIVTTSLPRGFVAAEYNHDLEATGGDGAPVWSVISGSLPPGLALSPAGTLSGTPTTPGTSSFSIEAQGGGQAVSVAFTHKITSAPIITAAVLPDGAVSIPYEIAIEVQGGDGVYSWSVTSGSLPPGLELTTEGLLRGTPTSPGVSPFTVAVESAGFTDSAELATTIIPLVSSVTALTENLTSTISGAGLGSALVSIDGTAAGIVSRTATQITFNVPVFPCLPLRNVVVSVSSNGTAAETSLPLEPGRLLAPLEVGQAFIDRGGFTAQGHCFQMSPEGDPAALYLLGFQSIAENVSSVTPVNVTGVVGSAGAVGAPFLVGSRVPGSTPGKTFLGQSHPVTGRPARASSAVVRSIDRDPRLVRHAEAHSRHMERMLQELRVLPRQSRPPTRTASQFAVVPNVGDVLALRVPDGCSVFTPVNGIVRAVGQRSIWVEDQTNPAGGMSTADYQGLSDQFDDRIGAQLDFYFGAATDLDANGRIIVLVTHEVNKEEGLLGFVASADLFPRTTCASSDVGEIYYGIAPDPDGLSGDAWSLGDVLDLYPSLIGHEVTHIIHISRQLWVRFASEFPTVWELEGIATFGEQLVGHAYTGLGSGQNLGKAGFDLGGFWYRDMFVDLAFFFGFQSPESRVDGAPEECSWLGRPPNGPCLGERQVYGPVASLFRHIADLYYTPATEQNMTRAIIDFDGSGYDLLEWITNDELDLVLSRWSIALAADDKWFDSGGFTFSSWDFNEIFGTFVETARLAPRVPTLDFAENVSVRGGSTAYFLVGEQAQKHWAFGAQNLPSNMRLWVVRVR